MSFAIACVIKAAFTLISNVSAFFIFSFLRFFNRPRSVLGSYYAFFTKKLADINTWDSTTAGFDPRGDQVDPEGPPVVIAAVGHQTAVQILEQHRRRPVVGISRNFGSGGERSQPGTRRELGTIRPPPGILQCLLLERYL